MVVIGIWLFGYMGYFSWNDRPMFRGMLSMSVLGFVITVIFYGILIANARVGIDSLLWGVAAVPACYPFYIIYIVLSSILMAKMWRFHGKYAGMDQSSFSVSKSGNYSYYV